MRKSKFKLSNAFYDNRFVFIFSIVCAAMVWAVVMVQFGNEKEKTITNVPVMIDYASAETKYGLKPFGETEFTVNLTLSGKRYIVEKSNIADEIVVKASAARVTTAGTYKLKIEVSTADPSPEFTITNQSKNEIEVFFDTYSEKEFPLEVVTKGKYGGSVSNIAPNGFCVGEPTFENSSSVKVSGPDTQVSKVTGVEATVTFDEQITDTEIRDAAISIVSSGATALLSTDRMNQSEPITFPVYRIAEDMPVAVEFTDKPSNYLADVPFSVSIYPTRASFGIRRDKYSSTEDVIIRSISFSELKPGENVFTVAGDDFVDMMLLDSDVVFVVTVNVPDMSMVTKTVDASRIEYVNQQKNIEVSPAEQSLDIRIAGPSDALAALTNDNIQIRVDLSDQTQTATPVILPAAITLKNSKECWVYGTYMVGTNVISK